MEIRERTWNLIANNEEFYSKYNVTRYSFDEFVKHGRRNGVYADNWDVSACSEAYNVLIKVYELSSDKKGLRLSFDSQTAFNGHLIYDQDTFDQLIGTIPEIKVTRHPSHYNLLPFQGERDVNKLAQEAALKLTDLRKRVTQLEASVYDSQHVSNNSSENKENSDDNNNISSESNRSKSNENNSDMDEPPHKRRRKMTVPNQENGNVQNHNRVFCDNVSSIHPINNDINGVGVDQERSKSYSLFDDENDFANVIKR